MYTSLVGKGLSSLKMVFGMGGGGGGIRALAGCKENHFYSLPFGQAEASIY